MNLSYPFITRPVMTTLIMIAIFVIGLASFDRLPVSSLPDVDYPTITVTVPFPGANPSIMANTVATPLEKQFMTIPGIRYVTSSNTLGSSSIVLQFELSRDVDLAAVDVESAIVAAKPQLPPDLPQDPTYKKVNPSATPIIYVAVTSSTMRQGELYDYANTVIGQRISIIDGVAQVSVYGSPTAVRAQIDPGALASMNLTQEQIATVIAQQNQYKPLGQFDGNHTASTIYDNAGLLHAEDYEPMIVAYKDGSPVRLSDLGVVVESLRNDRGIRRYADKSVNQPSVTLAVQRLPGANAVDVANDVRKLLVSLQDQLPASLDLIVVFDRSISIKDSIHDVELTLVIAFLLVILVIFFYLGKIRDTIIPSLVMPMSIISTFAVMDYLGYTLDSLSLLALTLSIGFIIDDAIVVLENIVRRIEQGETPLTASIVGSQQIGFTIVSMTVSLIAVFIPIIFMAGLVGKLFQEFAITLTIVTVASGIISLTLTPMLCATFLPPRADIHKGRFAGFSEHINDKLLSWYKSGLEWVLGRRRLMLGVGIACVLLSALLFIILPTDFIPDEDIGFIIAYTEAGQGTSSDEMNRMQGELLEILRKDPAINAIVSNSATPEYRQGIIFLSLVPPSERPAINKVIGNFQTQIKDVVGINVFFKVIPLIDLNVGTQVRGAYQYLMQSLDPKDLYTSAEALYDRMRDDPMFQGISTDLEIKTPQINLDIQRDLASSLGIDALSIEQAFLLGFSGNRISRIQTPIDQYDVILELTRDQQRSPLALNDMYIRSTITNELVPLDTLVNVSDGVGPASINHFSQFPAVTITFNIAQNTPLSTALERLRGLASQTLAPGVTGNVKGAAETFEESINSLSFLLIITVFAIYIILGMLYESFIHPLTILSTLPPAILGALLTLYITGRPLSLYAYLGIILLIGIVKKNGIMMVDFALDNIRSKGETAEKSIYDACLVRFRPIMMTTFAAILGALPIALGIGAGAESRRPLGFVIIGGMVVSQLITLFLTPVIYLYFEEFSEYLNRRFSSKKQ